MSIINITKYLSSPSSPRWLRSFSDQLLQILQTLLNLRLNSICAGRSSFNYLSFLKVIYVPLHTLQVLTSWRITLIPFSHHLRFCNCWRLGRYYSFLALASTALVTGPLLLTVGRSCLPIGWVAAISHPAHTGGLGIWVVDCWFFVGLSLWIG
jgi:hypothetical protein